MRSGGTPKSFPGTDSPTSDRMAIDVAADEEWMLAEMNRLRNDEGVSSERWPSFSESNLRSFLVI